MKGFPNFLVHDEKQRPQSWGTPLANTTFPQLASLPQPGRSSNYAVDESGLDIMGTRV
jgi:hypothetical protein